MDECYRILQDDRERPVDGRERPLDIEVPLSLRGA